MALNRPSHQVLKVEFDMDRLAIQKNADEGSSAMAPLASKSL